MSTDYNKIADEYKYSKSLPWRKHLEAYTVFKLAGDLSNKSVLDLACGEGFYSRLFKLHGASTVTGVDLSEQMIALAIQAEKSDSLGINYLVGNALNLNLGKQFDVVSASYLLNYAQNESELLTMCQVISKHLKPGGKFITVNNNPDCKQPRMSMRKYGFERIQNSFQEGDEVVYKLYLPDGNHIDIINYHLSKYTHEKCFESVGLRHVEFHNMKMSPEGIETSDESFWNDLLLCEPFIGITCLKESRD